MTDSEQKIFAEAVKILIALLEESGGTYIDSTIHNKGEAYQLTFTRKEVKKK
jgi:hypothetical protein